MRRKTRIIPLVSDTDSEDIPLSARSMTYSEYDEKINCQNKWFVRIIWIGFIGIICLISLL